MPAFLLSCLGVYGFYTNNYPLLYIGTIGTLIFSLYNIKFGGQNSLVSELLAAFIGWIVVEDFIIGICIGLCYESLILNGIGILVTIFCVVSNGGKIIIDNGNNNEKADKLEDEFKVITENIPKVNYKEDLEKVIRQSINGKPLENFKKFYINQNGNVFFDDYFNLEKEYCYDIINEVLVYLKNISNELYIDAKNVFKSDRNVCIYLNNLFGEERFNIDNEQEFKYGITCEYIYIICYTLINKYIGNQVNYKCIDSVIYSLKEKIDSLEKERSTVIKKFIKEYRESKNILKNTTEETDNKRIEEKSIENKEDNLTDDIKLIIKNNRKELNILAKKYARLLMKVDQYDDVELSKLRRNIIMDIGDILLQYDFGKYNVVDYQNGYAISKKIFSKYVFVKAKKYISLLKTKDNKDINCIEEK